MDIEGTPSDVGFDCRYYPNADVTLTRILSLAPIIMGTQNLALSGSTANVKAALAGTFANTYTGNVTLNDDDDTVIQATDITTIEGDTTGTITVLNKIDIEGTPSDVDAAFDDVDTFSADPNADVTLTSDPTLAQLVTINNKIEGTITLQGTDNYGLALSGSTANVKAALAGTFGDTYTGNVTLNDDDGTVIQATDITTIDGDTTGTITVLNKIDIKGTASQVDAAIKDVKILSLDTTTNADVTLTSDPTLAQLKAINNKIEGTITLQGTNNYSHDLSGSTADVKAALAGTFANTYTGNVILNDNDDVIQATDITTIGGYKWICNSK